MSAADLGEAAWEAIDPTPKPTTVAARTSGARSDPAPREVVRLLHSGMSTVASQHVGFARRPANISRVAEQLSSSDLSAKDRPARKDRTRSVPGCGRPGNTERGLNSAKSPAVLRERSNAAAHRKRGNPRFKGTLNRSTLGRYWRHHRKSPALDGRQAPGLVGVVGCLPRRLHRGQEPFRAGGVTRKRPLGRGMERGLSECTLARLPN